MVSLTISLTTSGLSASLYRKNYSTPSNCSSQSLCSTSPPPYQSQHQGQSRSRDYPSQYPRSPNSHHESVDALLPPIRSSTSIPRTGRRDDNTMAPSNQDSNAPSEAMPIERRRSFGRGGAGNIRRPSVVPYAPRTNEDGTPRRSSAWSISPGSSPEGRRASILNFFGKKNSPDEGVGGGEQEGVKFKVVDLTGK